VIEIEIRPMRPDERIQTAGVAARGMRDNPMHVAVFGADPDRRIAALDRMFRALFTVAPTPPRIALRAGFVVGVCGAAPPGTCRLPATALARMIGALATKGPGPLRRALRWFEAWSHRDPEELHWHVGPVAVEGGMQSLGIGGRLLAELTADLDARGEPAWLETDKADNVGFYERAGFAVAAEAEILGTPCWFMTRQERGRVRNVNFYPTG
jgi:ribosomal protein S18 acetylase RimI-like enzyme